MTYQPQQPTHQQYPQPGAAHPGVYGAAYTNPSLTPSGPRGLSITSLVLGVASMFLGWTLLMPIAGVILGIVGLRKEPDGKGFAIAGIATSAFALLSWIVTGLLIALFFGATLLPLLYILGLESQPY